ncbi:PH-domain-containing protein [Heliocybe sulcata]|uniref:PH-domain-containing protein n=1 Tax=Heliocybe sulcata TaxID=5364 RepID=A0A5C3MYM8_9AGAM|nr:PH-domain-containing protein [Heliocybe sulcata]
MTARSADPPSPQEVTRKLSLHSVAKPNLKKSNVSMSGTESDSESLFSPDQAASPPAPASVAGGIVAGSSTQPVLSAIAERHSASGEDSDDDDDDDDDGWPVADKKAKPRDSTEESLIKAGYLRKKGERRKTWKKRWFVLRPGHLAYYKTSAEYELLRLLDLNDVHACTPVALKRHSCAFGLVSPTRTYYLEAGSHNDMLAWVKAISEAREALVNTSAKNPLTSAPITIPSSNTRDANHPPHTPSPPAQSIHTHGFTSSESEDASSNPPRSFPTSSLNRPISSSPTKGQGIPANDPTKPVLSGYLMKCGSKRRNWRKRWFVLSGEQLSYSGSHMDTKPHRQVPLIQILDALEYDIPHRTGPAHVSPAGAVSPQAAATVSPDESEPSARKNTFKIVTTKRTLLLCAPSEEEEIKWLSAVRALIARRSGAGVVPGTSGGSSLSKPPGAASGSEIQHGHSASGSGSGNSGIRSMARRLSVTAGSSGFTGNAVPEEGAPDRPH